MAKGSSKLVAGGGAFQVKEAPYSYVYNTYRQQINTASELVVNPDNGHAYFAKSEAAVTPVITDFISNEVGTDVQIKKRLQKEYPDKMITISRTKTL